MILLRSTCGPTRGSWSSYKETKDYKGYIFFYLAIKSLIEYIGEVEKEEGVLEVCGGEGTLWSIGSD